MAADGPWLGDACSLVDAFRRRELSPLEALDATLAAIEASSLNAFSHLDPGSARAAAASADVELPFGGVPWGVKELHHVAGWPATKASLVLRDRVAGHDTTLVARLRAAGSVLVGLTTASEFGGLNVSVSRLNGVTGNPWQTDRTAGGSSGGSAAAVAGGLVPIATAGDGGGSIRIPAAFCGLPGLKCTYGRFPKGPHMGVGALTAVSGCVSRSVRDIARTLDVGNGFDHRDPYSLPRVDGFERGLGTVDLRGKRAVLAPTLGIAVLRPEVEAAVREHGEALARDAGLELVDVPVQLAGLGFEWAMSNMGNLLADLDGLWPACKDDLTAEIAFGLEVAKSSVTLELLAVVDRKRTEANEAMAALLDEVDVVIAATNPDAAYPAHITLNNRVGDQKVGPENNGALTIPANISGNPAISVPIGTISVDGGDGLPIGMQLMGRHHEEAVLLDLALVAERERPWPLVAPGAPF